MKVRFAISVGLGEPDAGQLDLIVDGAEARGFDSLWFSDLPMLPSTDPLLAVAYAAARTQRLRLGVNLVPFGYAPFVFARQVAHLDQLTGGRLLVTLVPGLDQPGERHALDLAGAHRGERLDALIPVLQSLWRGDAVPLTNGGQPVRLPVAPKQEPLEVWLGGSGPAAIRRAGRLGDGWLGALMAPEKAGAIRDAIQAAAIDANRTIDPEHFGLSIAYAREAADLAGAPRLRRAKAPDDDQRSVVPIGRDQLRAYIEQLVAHGLSKFVVRPVGAVTDWSDELDWLAGSVLDMQT